MRVSIRWPHKAPKIKIIFSSFPINSPSLLREIASLWNPCLRPSFVKRKSFRKRSVEGCRCDCEKNTRTWIDEQDLLLSDIINPCQQRVQPFRREDYPGNAASSVGPSRFFSAVSFQLDLARRDDENAPLSCRCAHPLTTTTREGWEGDIGVAFAWYVESTLAYYHELGHEPAAGHAEKNTNGLREWRGMAGVAYIDRDCPTSSTFARSPARVVVNKRGDDLPLLKRRTRYFSFSIPSVFILFSFSFFSLLLFSCCSDSFCYNRSCFRIGVRIFSLS